ncbi:MAG: hypothetical protein QM776_10865 [Rhodocyclaceae bacterium]
MQLLSLKECVLVANGESSLQRPCQNINNAYGIHGMASLECGAALLAAELRFIEAIQLWIYATPRTCCLPRPLQHSAQRCRFAACIATAVMRGAQALVVC